MFRSFANIMDVLLARLVYRYVGCTFNHIEEKLKGESSQSTPRHTICIWSFVTYYATSNDFWKNLHRMSHVTKNYRQVQRTPYIIIRRKKTYCARIHQLVSDNNTATSKFTVRKGIHRHQEFHAK